MPTKKELRDAAVAAATDTGRTFRQAEELVDRIAPGGVVTETTEAEVRQIQWHETHE